MYSLDFLGQSMAPFHCAPCCTPACGLGLPIRPFGHMFPLATCLACLPVPKSSLLPTRNFLSMAVSLHCSAPSTLLSQDPPASHPPYQLLLYSSLCLISSSGPGKRTACPRVAVSSSSKLYYSKDFCSLLFLVAYHYQFSF